MSLVHIENQTYSVAKEKYIVINWITSLILFILEIKNDTLTYLRIRFLEVMDLVCYDILFRFKP